MGPKKLFHPHSQAALESESRPSVTRIACKKGCWSQGGRLPRSYGETWLFFEKLRMTQEARKLQNGVCLQWERWIPYVDMSSKGYRSAACPAVPSNHRAPLEKVQAINVIRFWK